MSGEGLPACEFRGVNLTELYQYYPDTCDYSPQEYGAETFEFYITWLPFFGAALDMGHAIFGRDLAGHSTGSEEERLLTFLVAGAPGPGEKLAAMHGLRRVAARAALASMIRTWRRWLLPGGLDRC